MTTFQVRLQQQNVKEALKLATSAHSGTFRKNSNRPYIVHPISVASILLESLPNVDDDMLIAALLHDVVEDTEYTKNDITHLFGSTVSDTVDWLTNASISSGGNRSTRKSIDRSKIAKAPFKAQLIKVADIADNTSDALELGTEFALTYLNEKQKMMHVMSSETQATGLFKETLLHIETSLQKLSTQAMEC